LNTFVKAIFYGNYWISAAALCMACQTQYLLTGHFDAGAPVALFLFFGTLFIYSVHRLYALSKAPADKVSPYRPFSLLLKINVLISALASFTCWLLLPEAARWWTLVPCALAAAYISPVLPHGRRLRDIGWLKIFLIVSSWAWLTVALPAVVVGMSWSGVAVLMLFARAGFIFAIAMAFDLRDRQNDQAMGVATLAVKLGHTGSLIATGIGLLMTITIAWLLVSCDAFPHAALRAIGLTSVAAFLFVSRSTRSNLSPYFFLFGLDGLMILQFLLLFI